MASNFSDYRFEEKDDSSDSGTDEPKDAGDDSTKPTPDAGRDAERDAEPDVPQPCIPSGPDLCDGEDNDCDPTTEDGADEPTIGQPCDGEDEDLCEDGQNVCRDGQLVCDDDPETIEDICDGEDNDCNPDTPDGAGERRFGDACDGNDEDLCEEGVYICENNALICNDDSDSNRDMCDGEDNDCDPDTPDGAHDPGLGELCDGPDEDQCEEDEIICDDGNLVCSNTDDSIVDICNNDQDEDCDGRIVLCDPVEEFPGPNGASSAFDVFYDFGPIDGSWKIMCRNAKPGEIESAEWDTCPSEGNLPVKPFTEEQSKSEDLNGLSETQVRVEWESGIVSEPFSRLHYIHNSLHGVEHCEKASPELVENYFETAAQHLVRFEEDGGDWTTFTEPFDPPNDLQLHAPFIQLHFTPPLSGSFEVEDGDGNIEVLSLRKRFILHPDRLLLLMFRVYVAKRAWWGKDYKEECLALRTHTYVGETKKDIYDDHYFNKCDAVVLNRQGAGVCLKRNADDTADFVTAGRGVSLSEYSFWASEKAEGAFNAYYCLDSGYDNTCADNFMWRELVRERRTYEADTTTFEHFSPKCFGDPECVNADPENLIFLPDRDLFPDIFP